jgi:hypothetical protein
VARTGWYSSACCSPGPSADTSDGIGWVRLNWSQRWADWLESLDDQRWARALSHLDLLEERGVLLSEPLQPSTVGQAAGTALLLWRAMDPYCVLDRARAKDDRPDRVR